MISKDDFDKEVVKSKTEEVMKKLQEIGASAYQKSDEPKKDEKKDKKDNSKKDGNESDEGPAQEGEIVDKGNKKKN